MNILEQTKNGVPVLYADGIEAAGGAVHGFSTRKGGVSQGIFASLNLGLTRGDDRSMSGRITGGSSPPWAQWTRPPSLCATRCMGTPCGPSPPPM